MFDAARQESWDDAEIQNNYGFCLLLDNPSEALKAFEIAVELGFRLTVNTCNRILALFKLGHHAAALEVADQAIDRWSDLDAQESYLWDFEAAEPTLLAHANPRQYLLDLATHVAKESTDELVAARWIALRSRLGANAGS
jgi:tetratricopeptide (TPR) repeat protein